MTYMDDDTREEELLTMFSCLTRKKPSFSYWKYNNIESQLDDISQEEFKADFRFQKSELEILYDALKMPKSLLVLMAR